MYTVVDFETTTKTAFKRKANPFHGRNKIVLCGLKPEDAAVIIEPNTDGLQVYLGSLFCTTVLIGHNFKFDMLYIWNKPWFQDWLAKGGKVWDTMVAEFLLSAQQDKYPSLDDLSLKYGGTLKDDRVKQMWKAGIDTDQIDPAILKPYLEQDLLNTEKAYLAQLEACRRAGMLPLVEGYMEHLLALTEMEFNGLYVDVSAAQDEVQHINAKISELQQDILGLVADKWADMPMPLDYHKPAHLSALIFNTPVKGKKDEVILDVFGEPRVYDKGAVKAGQVAMKKVDHWYSCNGFNVSTQFSRPYKASGAYSTDAEILEDIKKMLWEHPESDSNEGKLFRLITLILEERKLRKQLTTYLYGCKLINKSKKVEDLTVARGYSFERWIEKQETGMLPLVYPQDQCIHHTLDMVQAVTGRINASKPNCQNIPKTMRRFFTSHFGEKGRIVEFDYSQLEVVIQAYLSQSEKMMADIAAGMDFHIKRLAYAEEKTYNECSALVKSGSAEWKEKRRKAKIVSFRRAYGAHMESIAEAAELPVFIVERIFEAESAEYPEVAAFIESIKQTALRTRVPTNVVLPLKDKDRSTKDNKVFVYRPEIKQGVGYYQSLTGKIYAFYELATTSEKLKQHGKDPFIYFSGPELANYAVQGTAADIVAMQVGRVWRLIQNNPHIKLVNEVHDSLVLDVDYSIPGIETILAMIQTTLEDVDGLFHSRFDMRFNCKIKVDMQIGTNWKGDMDE